MSTRLTAIIPQESLGMPHHEDSRIETCLRENYDKLEEWAIEAYGYIDQKGVVLPEEVFLHTTGQPEGRFISMGCIIQDLCACHKWISSFPENLKQNPPLPRGSALITLSNVKDGRVLATLDGASITRYRTVAGIIAVLRRLRTDLGSTTVSLVGCGAIHRTLVEYWREKVGTPSEWILYDIDDKYAERFRKEELVDKGVDEKSVRVVKSIPEAIRGQKIVSFATTAKTAHVASLEGLPRDAVILHISLRDLAPACIRAGWNVTDDIEQALTQNTSLENALLPQPTDPSGYLAPARLIAARLRSLLRREKFGPRDIATFGDILSRDRQPPVDKPVIISPFGLAVLDGVFAWKVLERIK